MENMNCRKCKLTKKTNRVEVFAYDVWRLCAICEKEFYAHIESFFIQPERSKREEFIECGDCGLISNADKCPRGGCN